MRDKNDKMWQNCFQSWCNTGECRYIEQNGFQWWWNTISIYWAKLFSITNRCVLIQCNDLHKSTQELAKWVLHWWTLMWLFIWVLETVFNINATFHLSAWNSVKHFDFSFECLKSVEHKISYLPFIWFGLIYPVFWCESTKDQIRSSLFCRLLSITCLLKSVRLSGAS